MRRAHFLKPNKGSESPQLAIWCDTETRERRVSPTVVEHVLTFGYACASRRLKDGHWSNPDWLRFETRGDFWSWVEAHTRPRTRLYLFAHNWSFDAAVLGLFEELPRLGWTLERAVVEGPPIIITYRKGDRTITMLDTLNWWRAPLSDIGKSVGLPKLPFPGKGATQEEWETYGRRDVEIIHRAVLEWWEFLKSNDLGGFAPTLASQALRSYRHRFMSERILIDDNPKALTLARGSMHGGRVECGRLGRVAGPIWQLDVNSMYPFVMRDHLYPARLRFYESFTCTRDLREWIKTDSVVADVDLETDVPAYAHYDGERLIFPVGRFRERLTTPDVAFALAHGHVRKVHAVAVYERADLFSSFVDYMYRERLRRADGGDALGAWLFKILLNSLYGKFGQRGEVWEEVERVVDLGLRVWMELDYDLGEIVSYRQFGGLVQRQATQTEAANSHPAIASHVTAFARRHLWGLMERAGHSEVVYCDTDSVWVTERGFERLSDLIHPFNLGALKVEAIHRAVTLHGPKDYETENGAKTKGVRRSAIRLGPHSWRQEKWSSLKGLLKVGKLDAPRVETIEKTLRRTYCKGRVSTSGRVSPFHLREW